MYTYYMDNQRCLVVPGLFLPSNDTNSLLAYKHLRLLPLQYDVYALKAAADDDTLAGNFNSDPEHGKFHVHTVGRYDDVLFSIRNVNLFKGLRNMRKYVDTCVNMYDGQKYLYTMTFPCYSTRVGVQLKKQHPEIFWIAAFSDPVNHSPYKFDEATYKAYSLPEKIAFKLYLKYYVVDQDEADAFEQADRLVFICPEQRDFMIGEYLKYFGRCTREELLAKSVIVPLNYIPEWNRIRKADTVKTEDTFILAHFGRVYGLRLIEEFIHAFAEFVRRHPEIPVRVEQYGEFRRSDMKLIRALSLQDHFIVHDKIPYEECIRRMNASDAVLLFDTILPEDTIQPYLPSKIMEYSLLQKDCLAVTTKTSPSYRIMNESNACACRYDRKDILRGLEEMIIGHRPSVIQYSYSNEEAVADLKKAVLNED